MHKVLKKITALYSDYLYRDVKSSNEVSENYFVWNYADDRGGNFSDDRATTEEISIQLHWFISKDVSFETAKREIRKAFEQNGFTYPEVTVLYEKDTKMRHIIFETGISVELEE